MTSPTVGRLRVDGASLHYEVRGNGPLLLLIPGGTGGAASFDGVADDLAAAHTVVSYDPRGLSRSPLDEPEAGQRVEQHADDAYRLLELLAPGEPARVAGCSSGAIVALHLLVTRPERLERVVAHEPPVVEVLPDAAVHRALLARVQDTFRREGLMPAAAVFAAGLTRPGGEPAGSDSKPAGSDSEPARPRDQLARPGDRLARPGDELAGPGGEPDRSGGEAVGAQAITELPPEARARVERTMADMPFFLERIVPSFMAYAPDLDRLTALSDRLVLAGGTDSRGELPHRAAAFLAERIGARFVHFPGGHTGLSTHPAEFGELLRKVLDA